MFHELVGQCKLVGTKCSTNWWDNVNWEGLNVPRTGGIIEWGGIWMFKNWWDSFCRPFRGH
jgi:hypothetical protein